MAKIKYHDRIDTMTVRPLARRGRPAKNINLSAGISRRLINDFLSIESVLPILNVMCANAFPPFSHDLLYGRGMTVTTVFTSEIEK